MRCLKIAIAALLAGTALALPQIASAQERTVKITGFGAKSGVVRVFGVNSEAALKDVAHHVVTLSHVEDLPAHGAAVTARFE